MRSQFKALIPNPPPPSFPRRACPVLDTGREPIPGKVHSHSLRGSPSRHPSKLGGGSGLIWLFTIAVIAAASAVACSSGEPDSPDDNVEQAAQTIDQAAPPSLDGQIFVSDKGFIKVGISIDNIDDVYPPGLDPSCVSPGPGYPPPAALPAGSPPKPGYLPEGFALKKEHHSPDGRHVGDSYVGAGRFSVSHWACGGLTLRAEAHWELVTVAGHWGILFDGACFAKEGADGGCDFDPDFARTLWFETDQGYVVEIRSLIVPLDKIELLKIAESMPVFDTQTGGSRATVNKS